MSGNPNPDDATRELFSSPGGAAESYAIAAGTRLKGRYLIERELGRGGIGVVYLARDERLHGMPVVIKFLLDNSTQSAWLSKKFLQEAEALTRIKHPGVVKVIDRDRAEDGKPFFVMEFVKGKPLRSVINSEGLDLEYAALLIRQIGQALSAAHREGVLHRDLKPENIMLETLSDGDEHVKLIDFGIAKIRDSELGATTDVSLIVGSLHYIPPEQISGQPVSASSDIYAFGIIAYELITGRRPFRIDARNQVAALQQLMEMQRGEQIPMPKMLRPSVPDAAQAILLQALSFEPQKRPQDVRKFGDDLARALTDSDASTKPLLAPTLPLTPESSAAIAPITTVRQVERATQKVEPLTPIEPASVESKPRSKRWVLSLALGAGRRRLSFQIMIGAVATMFIVGVFTTMMIDRRAPNSPPAASTSNGSTPTAAAQPEAEHSLTYFVTVQDNPKLYPGKKPYRLPGEVVFHAGDRVRFNFTSPQPGYLYVINESPPLGGGATAYNILFPTPTSNGGSAQLVSGQEVQIPDRGDGFVFDAEEGTEKLWLIWSAKPIDQLESLKRWANPEDKGEIKDLAQSKGLGELLAGSSQVAPDEQRDDYKTTLKARAERFVKLVKLQHH